MPSPLWVESSLRFNLGADLGNKPSQGPGKVYDRLGNAPSSFCVRYSSHRLQGQRSCDRLADGDQQIN